jgi:hypothetical protein
MTSSGLNAHRASTIQPSGRSGSAALSCAAPILSRAARIGTVDPMKDDQGRGADLLTIVDAMVRRDRGPSGLTGEIGVGVVTADHRETWWRARFGAAPEIGFVDELPWSAEALLVLGEAEAAAILQGRALPTSPDLLEIHGDRDLFDRFLERYVYARNVVSLRAQHRAPTARKKRAAP